MIQDAMILMILDSQSLYSLWCSDDHKLDSLSLLFILSCKWQNISGLTKQQITSIKTLYYFRKFLHWYHKSKPS